MVNPRAERRDSPEYSLEHVRRLADYGSVQYAGRRVYLDVQNLRLTLADVCQCLQELQESDFCHSERYPDDPRWRDVYKTRFLGPNDLTYDLYIKFLLNRDCVLILLNSFHP